MVEISRNSPIIQTFEAKSKNQVKKLLGKNKLPMYSNEGENCETNYQSNFMKDLNFEKSM